MERRALIAFAISLVILIAYQEIVRRVYPPPEQIQEPAVAPTPLPQLPPSQEPAAAEAPKPVAVPVTGKDIVVETDLYRAIFTTAGARLKSFQLKRFRTTVNPDSPPLDLLAGAIENDLPLGLELRGPGQTVVDTAVAYSAD